ncbi:MAG: stalk domain-containing protein [Tissierellaceae bacterium]|nr:stalk domain-containing protein [Tissierellaceae bacterium]
MKKYLKGLITGVVITLILTGTFGYASQMKQTIEVLFNSVNLEVNGKTVNGDNILYNGTTYVPLRRMAEMLGKEVGWNQTTYTASINDKVLKGDHDTSNAKFIGRLNNQPGDKWYKAETKYVDIYFYNNAVKMEWVVEELDDMVEYLLAFRGEVWKGNKARVYMTDVADELKGMTGYRGSVMLLDNKTIIISADTVDSVLRKGNFDDLGTEIIWTEDPRFVLVHELSHFINHPDMVDNSNKWIEEGLAYYLAFNYNYKQIDSNRYPDEAKMRKFTQFLFAGMDNGYDSKTGVDYIIHDKNSYLMRNLETQKSVFTFQGMMDVHYGRTGIENVRVDVFEASVIEFLIDTFGKDKLVEFYKFMHETERIRYIFNDEIANHFGHTIPELEEQWRKYVGIDDDYREIMN